MSHDAFRVSVVADGVRKFKVECVAMLGRRVVAGCSDGALRVYGAEPLDQEDSTADGLDAGGGFREISCKTGLTKKAITHLAVVEPLDMIIIGSDHAVLSLEASSFKQLQSFDTKGSRCHGIEISPEVGAGKSRGCFQLCIITRPRLLVFRYDKRQANNNSFKWQPTAILPVPDKIRALVWCGDRACVGFKDEYNFIHLDTGEAKEICETGKAGPALALLRIPSGDATTTPVFDTEILLVKDNYGVCIGFDGSHTRFKQIQWNAHPSKVVFLNPYVLALQGSPHECIDVRNISTGSPAKEIPMKQATCLVARYSFSPENSGENNSCVLVASATKIIMLEPIPIAEQIDALVKGNFYEEALSLCEGLNEDAHSLYKDHQKQQVHTLYGYQLFNEKKFMKSMQHFQGNCLPRQVLALFPDVLPSGQDIGIKHPIPINPIEPDELIDALTALIPFLFFLRSRFQTSESLSRRNARLGQRNSMVDENISTEDEYSDSGFPVFPLRVLVDTMLLHCYLITGDDLVMTFLEPSNKCDLQETERLLLQYEKFEELVYFYRTRGLHRRALSILRKYSQTSSIHHSLNGPAPTVEYLTELALDNSYEDIVLEFSEWVLQSYPDQGLQIFIQYHGDPKFIPEKAISYEIVLAHLEKFSDQETCLAFLDSLTTTQQDLDPIFKNRLIMLHIERAKSLLNERNANSQAAEMLAGNDDLSVEGSMHYISAGSEPGQLGIARKKLLNLLQNTSEYSAEVLLSALPSNSLLEERALIFSKIGKHKEALLVLIEKLRQPTLAEQYCEKNWNPKDPGTKDLYLLLMQLMLCPPTGSKQNLSFCLELLNSKCDRINPRAALLLLPQDLPLSFMVSWFERVSSLLLEQQRSCEVTRNLKSAENLQVREEYLRISNQSFKVSGFTKCRVCGQKFGHASTVVLRYPNGVVIDYKCLKDKYECPITHKRFI